MSPSDRVLSVIPFIAAAVLAPWLAAAPCVGQTSLPAVQPASYNRTLAAPATQSICFGRRAPQIGDQLEQNLSVQLELTSTVRQGSEILQKSKTALDRRQRRLLTTTHVRNGMTIAVTVRYAEAAKQIATGPADGQLGQPQQTPQPVQGKTYHVRRDGEALLITDADDAIPPLDQYEIVALNMDSLGRPNPLADFLAGKTLTVGQRIALPNEVAEKLMGLGSDLGKVSRFELTLRKVATIRGAPAPSSTPRLKRRRSIRRRCGWWSRGHSPSRPTPAARSKRISPARSACPNRAAVFPRLTK